MFYENKNKRDIIHISIIYTVRFIMNWPPISILPLNYFLMEHTSNHIFLSYADETTTLER